jgi:hypothetical protein
MLSVKAIMKNLLIAVAARFARADQDATNLVLDSHFSCDHLISVPSRAEGGAPVGFYP